MNDLLILKELKDINKDLSILVASYHKGYVCFIENGFKPLNLGLKPKEELTLKAGFRIWSIIRKFKPDLVVTDEVFIALHITKGLKIPSILITHWFFETLSEKHPIIPAIKKADHVIFVDTPEFHKIPRDYNVNLTFVGPVIREFEYGLKDKGRARKELDIEKEDKVILVTPGGGHQVRSKFLEISLEAFKELDGDNLKFIILAGELCEEFIQKYGTDNRIIIKDFDWQMDRLMVASDLVICKGSFSITWELAYLGIPSISIPDVSNPIDQIHVNRMDKRKLTLRIDPRKFNKNVLIENIREFFDSKCNNTDIAKVCKEVIFGRGQREAAEEINYFINRVTR
jgi:uncharacterized protein (TIGR00661 family)